MGDPTTAPASTASKAEGLSFRLGPIPVLIRPAFFLIPLLGSAQTGLERGVAWGVVVLASVLAHELGHALTMRAFGFTPSIELHMMGGLTHYPRGARPSAGRDLLVTAAGPATGLVLGGALVLARTYGPPLDPTSLGAWMLYQAIFANVGWSLVNLLPALPWDGGLMLDAGLKHFTGRDRPRIVSVVSLVTGALVLLFGVAERQMMLGYFGLMGVVNGWQRLQAGGRQRRLSELWKVISSENPAEGERLAAEALRTTTDATMRSALEEFIAWARVFRGDFAGAKEAMSAMRDATPSLALSLQVAKAGREWGTLVELLEPRVAELRGDEEKLELLVEALVAQGAAEKVVALCEQLCEGATSTPRVVHEASAKLFHAGFFEASVAICARLFERFGDRVAAVNAACCHARLGRLDEGLAWIQRAVDSGYSDVEHLETDEDLAALRACPEFAEFVRRARAESVRRPTSGGRS